MKIVCESCGAKYSIADDRVTGKVFKIRCKRCSEVIIVRGDQQAQQADEPPAAESPSDSTAIWHIVVEGEQAGPYTPQQLGEMLTAQTVDWDAYVWTEGFDNWLPMREVTDLVSQITGQGAQAQAAPQQAAVGARAAAYRSAVHETLSGQPSMGADPFADDAGASEPSLFGNGSAAHAPDLFARGPARAAASPFAGSDGSGVVASAPSPRMGAEQVMTGARNENSVLFSLKNLQALATGSGGTSLPPSTAAAASTGYASGEGSGLIDIRALATTTGMGESSGGGGARDELLSIGSHQGAFGALGSPMLAPVSDDGDSGKKMLIWAGVAAVAIVSAASVAIIYFMRTPTPQAAPVAMLAQSAPANTVAAAQPPAPEQPAAAPAGEKLSEGELAARAAAANGEPSQGRERSGSSDHESRRRRESSKSEGSSEPAPAAAPEKPSAPSKPSGPRSIDDLLDGALSGSSSSKGSKPAESAAPNANLPENPAREQVMSAMNGVKPAVQACANGQGGVAMVTVSVAGETGRVTNAQVGGVTGPAGSCIAQAVRKAQFPKFRNKVFKIQFPFKL